MSRLKSCPYCSSSNVKVNETLDGKYYVQCSSCLVRTRDYEQEAEAMNRWNDRAQETYGFVQHIVGNKPDRPSKIVIQGGEVRLENDGEGLKRCPYCGKPPEIVFDVDGQHWQIACHEEHEDSSGDWRGKPGVFRTFLESFYAWQEWE